MTCQPESFFKAIVRPGSSHLTPLNIVDPLSIILVASFFDMNNPSSVWISSTS